MPKFNPTLNSSQLKNGMPKDMQAAAARPLGSILHIDKSDGANVAAQLDDTGVLGVAEAYISGWTMQDIAKALRGSVVAVMQWENALGDEDKSLLRQAKTANLEQLESHLMKLMQSELGSGGIEEQRPEGLSEEKLQQDIRLAALTDKRIQSIQRVLSAAQQQLERYQKASERDKGAGSEVHITQMIVSNEWLAALPKE